MTKETYLSSFANFPKNQEKLSWLTSIRRNAIDRFADIGFPSTRWEEWKHTDVAPVTKIRFARSENGAKTISPDSLKPFLPSGWESNPRLVFVNGRYNETLSDPSSLPQGATLKSLSQAFAENSDLIQEHFGKHASFEHHSFAALNTAFAQEGAFLHLKAGTTFETPIDLIFVAAPGLQPVVIYPRILIVAEKNTEATIVETYVGTSRTCYFSNAVSEISISENAVIRQVKVGLESPEAFHISSLGVSQQRDSRFMSHSISMGGALVRNDLASLLDAEGAECTLNGLYLTAGTQHVDHHTTIDHAKPHCTSHELYKGILNGKSHGVFHGKVIVRPDAQKSDAQQTNNNLILSEESLVDTTPQLEILADDVKCSHGATVGKLNEQELFYLRSRGIGLQEARVLLIRGFAAEVLDNIEGDGLRKHIEWYVGNQFAICSL